MKFRVTFKTPNATDAIDRELESEYNVDSDERYLLGVAMKELASQFIEYDECITIEFDTETKSATVVPLRKR